MVDWVGNCSVSQAHADICDELIPLEIALRCARAVMSGDAFATYIVIPMWPEGATNPRFCLVNGA